MAGSLKTVLLIHQTHLSWETRITFATDIASGMAYLHDRGTVHRGTRGSILLPIGQPCVTDELWQPLQT